jgi:hypothetical protein
MSLPKTFRFYGGRIAHLDESPCERMHAVMNGLERLHVNTKGWAQKRHACEKDLLRARLLEVKEQVATIKEEHTRFQSIGTTAKKELKAKQCQIANDIRLSELDTLLDSVFAEFGHLVRV